MKKEIPKKITLVKKVKHAVGYNDKFTSTNVEELKTPTNQIAYKLSCEFLKEKIYGPKVRQFSTEDSKHLLGILFEFRESVKPKGSTDSVESYSDHINVSKVFYNPAKGNPFYKKYMNLILNDVDQMFPIENIQQKNHVTGRPEYSKLSSVAKKGSSNKTYFKLDAFPNTMKIDFVLFTMSQIIPLINYYDDLILSGCELKLCRKLSHPPIGDEPLVFDENYFTLKLEGMKIDWEENSITKNLSKNSIVGPGFAVGPPCPPSWYSFSAALNEAISLHPRYIKTDITPLKSISKSSRGNKNYSLDYPFNYNTIGKLRSSWMKYIITPRMIKPTETRDSKKNFQS